MVSVGNSIYDPLYMLADRIDKAKASPVIGNVSDGQFLDVAVANESFCCFRIEVTPQLFDLSAASHFSVGDILHGYVDYRKIILALADGEAQITNTTRLSIISQARLKISLPGDDPFVIKRSSSIRKYAGFDGKFVSYLE